MSYDGKSNSFNFAGETYFERIKDSKNPAKIRLKILEYLFECRNVSETARKLGVSRKTIKKWEARYYERGIEGLNDRCKTPKTNPKAISKEIENLIIAIKDRYPDYGVRKIKKLLELEYNIHVSIHPIYRILKSAGLIKNGNDVK
jgi:transposase